jgi:transposase InsO family protein
MEESNYMDSIHFSFISFNRGGGTVLYLIQKSKKEERLVNSVLKSNDIQISMDGKGRWVDNVMVERLWRSVKYEWCNLNIYLKD